MRKLLTHPRLPPELKDLVCFALCVGLRPQELHPLRRAWITGLDGPQPMLRIEHHKTSDASKVYIPRSVPLNGMAAEIVRRQIVAHPESGRVFHDGGGQPYQSAHALRQRLQRWAKRAGIGHITTYSLRHSFGTALAKNTNLEVVRQVMGHSKIDTTTRYVSNNEGYHRDAVARAEEALLDILRVEDGTSEETEKGESDRER